MSKRNTDNPRKLSQEESKRQKQFVEYSDFLQSQGYRQELLTIPIKEANKQAFILGLPVVVILGAVFFLLHQFAPFGTSPLEILLLLVLFLVLVVVHELIHGITWSCFAEKRFKAISFGIMNETYNPYCTCNEALTRTQYIIGALAPTVILGILPCVIAIAIGSAPFFLLGALMILAGGGDFFPTNKQVKLSILTTLLNVVLWLLANESCQLTHRINCAGLKQKHIDD